MFGMGPNTELAQKYTRVKVLNDIHVRMFTHIYRQTNIPDFQIVLYLRVSRSFCSLAKYIHIYICTASTKKVLNSIP